VFFLVLEVRVLVYLNDLFSNVFVLKQSHGFGGNSVVRLFHPIIFLSINFSNPPSTHVSYHKLQIN